MPSPDGPASAPLAAERTLKRGQEIGGGELTGEHAPASPQIMLERLRVGVLMSGKHPVLRQI